MSNSKTPTQTLDSHLPHTTPDKFPKNGLLSGMILTAAAAVVVIALVFMNPSLYERFDIPLTSELRLLFLASIFIMVAHKAESYFFHEFDQCPVYHTTGRAPSAQNVRQAIFLSFVPTFLGMMFMVYFALVGPPWHMILIAIWLGQGLHEFHHSAKSLSRRRIYPGFFTSLAFVCTLSFGIFPRWHDALFETRGLFFYGYYFALPLILVAFYFEDRKWTTDTPREVWAPAPSK